MYFLFACIQVLHRCICLSYLQSGMSTRARLYSLVFVLSLIGPGQAFLDDEVAVSLNPFQLSCSPRHVVNQVTRDVTIRCAHDGPNRSKLGTVTRIRLLKKSPTAITKWQLLAEQRGSGDVPHSPLNIPVSGRIDSDTVPGTFLSITWPLAVDDTFGVYRCDVIGFLHNSIDMASEVSPQMNIMNEEVDARDMFSLLDPIGHELSSLKNRMIQFNENITSLNENVISVKGELEHGNTKVASLKQQIDLVNEIVLSTKTLKDDVNGRLNSLGTDVNMINSTLATVPDNVAIVEGQVTSINEDLDSISGHVDSVIEDVSSLKLNAIGLHGDFRSANTTVESAKETLMVANLNLDSVGVLSDSAAGTVDDLQREAKQVKEQMVLLGKKLQSVKDQVSSLTETVGDYNADALHSWPKGVFALLQPTTGCPVDLTFFGRTERYFKIHTESIHENQDDAPDFLGHYAKTSERGKEFITLWFCEANGLHNTVAWPRGSYCINQLFQETCPDGFEESNVYIDSEDLDNEEDYTTRSVKEGANLLFCCRSDGSHAEAIQLPTYKPFLLYRSGGHCQRVEGMDVSEGAVLIDTENWNNLDSARGPILPDVVLSGHNKPEPMVINLCHYIKS